MIFMLASDGLYRGQMKLREVSKEKTLIATYNESKTYMGVAT